MAIERQTSFAAGELAPTLWGRTDIAAYQIGARRLFNFFVSPHGIAVNRPGTHMVAKLGAANGGGVHGYWTAAGRLIPFVYSDNDAVVFVLPPNGQSATIYRRVGKVTSYVVSPTGQLELLGTGQVQEDVTLRKLRYAHIGQVLWLVHPEFRPREFRRVTISPEDWGASNLSFEVPPYPLVDWGGPYDIAKGGEPKIMQAVDPDDPGGETVPGPLSYDWGKYLKLVGGDEDHAPERWSWLVTKVLRTQSGRTYETLPFPASRMMWRPRLGVWSENINYVPSGSYGDINWYVFVPGTDTYYKLKLAHINKKPPNATYWDPISPDDLPSSVLNYRALPEMVALSADWPLTIDWKRLPGEPGAFGVADDILVKTRIYRGRDGRYGSVGETESDFFVDEGQTPVWGEPPPAGVNPFKVYDGEGNLLREEKPSVIGMHQNRLLLGATPERPSVIWGSKAGAYTNFDEVVPPDQDDAFQHEIASHRLETIKALISRRELMVLTSSSEWLVTGSASELITPTSKAAYPLSEHGSGDLAPLSVGETVFFVQRKGTIPRAIVPADSRQGFAPRDIATLSSHLFLGRNIVDWCYAEDPWRTLWAVRDDGALLSFAYVPEHELYAWAQHDLSGGKVESITSIPEGKEDAVYLIVNRNGTRYLERMASRVITDVRDCMFLDCAVTYDGRNTDPTKTAKINGASGEIFAAVTVDLGNESNVGSAVGKVLQLDGACIELTAHNGASNYAGTIIDPARLPVTSLNVVRSDWAWCISTATGLAHLNGKAVKAVVDGNVIDGLTVNAGSVPLGSYAGVVHVGLAYVSELEQLDIAQERNKPKTVPKVYVEIEGTRGGYVGPTIAKATTMMKTRVVDDGYGVQPLKRMEVEVALPTEWQKHGRVAVVQKDPLPMAVLGIGREVVHGGG